MQFTVLEAIGISVLFLLIFCHALFYMIGKKSAVPNFVKSAIQMLVEVCGYLINGTFRLITTGVIAIFRGIAQAIRNYRNRQNNRPHP
ncbi:MAG: hypothetical protein V1928_00170 [Parcubacteria group bacterium]